MSRIGVVVTVAAVALVGAVFDLGTGSGLRAVFAVLLLLGGVAAAALARRTEIIVALVAVPIVYGGCVLLAAIADLPAGGTLLRTLPYQVVTEIVASTPSLLVATVVTLSVVAFRRLLHAPPLRPRSPNLRRS